MVTTIAGLTPTIIPGVIDKASVHLYTRGQCAALAAALVEAQVGTPVFETHLTTWIDWTGASDYEKLEAGAEHLLVRLPDGRLLDIEGIYDADEYVATRTNVNSRCFLIPMNPDAYVHFVRSNAICALDMVPQDVDLASMFVHAVVTAYVEN